MSVSKKGNITLKITITNNCYIFSKKCLENSKTGAVSIVHIVVVVPIACRVHVTLVSIVVVEIVRRGSP